MPEFQNHDPGTFCYIELATTDPDAAGEFYRELFGWIRSDQDMGEHGIYTQFTLDGKVTGAMHELTPDMEKNGVPAHWGSYVTVKDVDASAAKATELGGNVLFGPCDVMDAGRTSVVQDPQGATFSLWQPKQHPGLQLRDEDDTLCWCELLTPDTDAATAFYGGLLGWEAETSSTEGMRDYTSFRVGGGRPAAGMMAVTPEMGPIPTHWLDYFQTDDCAAKENKAVELGAKAIVPTTDIPHIGKFAILHDPQGAVFGLFESGAEA